MSPESDVFAFGMLLGAIFWDIPRSDSVRIQETSEGCPLTDPNARPALEVVVGSGS
jgi:hypothetical protein